MKSRGKNSIFFIILNFRIMVIQLILSDAALDGAIQE